MSLFSRLVVSTTHAAPVEKVITGTKPGKALARRFVAGDTLDEAVDAARGLNHKGLLVSLDLLGEEVHDEASARAACDEYLESLDRIESEGLDANISVKLTQLGLSIDRDLTVDSIGRLAERAAEIGTTVTIDMEDSRFTDDTVEIYAASQAQYGNLGIALQSYMKRTPDDLIRLMPLGGHIRLCKGAYVEPAEIALKTKSAVDAAYARQLKMLMASEVTRPAVATHDLDLIDLTRGMAPQRIAPFEFQMLYGVQVSLQEELVSQGFPLRIYLPFGSQWYPYLTRRMAERPANALFFVRSLFG
ncbi:MAG: proline dehydrogenase family protein [Acidimicrobiia bacterium]|nr:proline dehydrogenase family protein [Acidimicrobiia bacterium]